MLCLVQGGEFLPRGCFLGLDEGHPLASRPLNPHLLIETTAVGEGLVVSIGQALVVCLACRGGTSEADRTPRLDHEEVFERVTRLLATGEVLRVLGIGGAMEGSLWTIRPTRGGAGPTFTRCAASRRVQSSAVRAGRSAWGAQARFNTGWRR
jgi:hypothetical protein